MTTIVEFRHRRDEADAARVGVAARPPCPYDAAGAALDPGAEIILLPLTWLKRIGQSRARKPLKRRFDIRGLAPA